MDVESRFAKSVAIGIDWMDLDVTAGIQNKQMMTMYVHAMFRGRSFRDTVEASPFGDEVLAFVFPAPMIPVIMKNLAKAWDFAEGRTTESDPYPYDDTPDGTE